MLIECESLRNVLNVKYDKNLIDEIDRKYLYEELDKQIGTLNEREQLVIYERYWNEATLRSIGKLLKISRERIRQIELKALCKLRHPQRSASLERIILALPNKDYQHLIRKRIFQQNQISKENWKIYEIEQRKKIELEILKIEERRRFFEEQKEKERIKDEEYNEQLKVNEEKHRQWQEKVCSYRHNIIINRNLDFENQLKDLQEVMNVMAIKPPGCCRLEYNIYRKEWFVYIPPHDHLPIPKEKLNGWLRYLMEEVP